MTKKKKIIISGSLIVIIIAIILFALASRYLIEKEETPISASDTIKGTEDQSDSNTGEATYDDWNYTRDDLKVKIEQVKKGSGDDKVTYFVADVQIKDTSDLYSAFAKK